MRSILDPRLSRARIRHGRFASEDSYGLHGAFRIMGPCGRELAVIAADGTDPEAMGWEHVSVSTKTRCPNWPEMCFIKDLFWGEDETVLQFHPRRSEYVNFHPYTLHLWKQVDVLVELPPALLIGPVGEVA